MYVSSHVVVYVKQMAQLLSIFDPRSPPHCHHCRHDLGHEPHKDDDDDDDADDDDDDDCAGGGCGGDDVEDDYGDNHDLHGSEG